MQQSRDIHDLYKNPPVNLILMVKTPIGICVDQHFFLALFLSCNIACSIDAQQSRVLTLIPSILKPMVDVELVVSLQIM